MQGPDIKNNAPPQLVVISSADAAKSRPTGARQRLEEEFRQRFQKLHPQSDLVTASHDAEPVATINGRT